MLFLTQTCPHCRTQEVSMNIVSFYQSAIWVFAFVQCNKCRYPNCAMLESQGNRLTPFQTAMGNVGHINSFDWFVREFWPPPPVISAPEHLPPAVHKAFIAAETTYPHPGLEEATAGSYGRALDVGTKLIAAEEADADEYRKLLLFARLNKLAAAKRITPSLAEWAHHIRSVRNDALHEIDSMDREELSAVRGFSEMVLRYLFTLPGMLAERKAAAAAGLSAPPESSTA